VSADGALSLFWGDGEQRFRFAIGQWRELQEKVNARRIAIGAPAIGPTTLLNALRAKDAWPDDIRDILRLGLVGGGLTPQEAHRLLANYFDGKPPFEHMQPAFLILFAGLVGVPSDPIGAKKKRPRVRTSRSNSPSSTATAQP
jgi:hypothetical protein